VVFFAVVLVVNLVFEFFLNNIVCGEFLGRSIVCGELHEKDFYLKVLDAINAAGIVVVKVVFELVEKHAKICRLHFCQLFVARNVGYN